MLRGLKSLLAGLLAGTALGVLFSPKKGDEIREEFKKELEKGGSGLKTVKNTIFGLGHEIGESAQEVKKTDTYKKGAKKAKKAVSKARRQARAGLKKAKKKFSRE